MLIKLRQILNWFENHESLITAILNFLTALILLYKAF